MFSLLTALVLTSGPIQLAAPGLTMVNLDPKLSSFYTGHLGQQLNFQGVRVVTSSDFATLLGFERQQQLMGCADDKCKAMVIDALGVDGLIVGQVVKLDHEFRLDVKVLETGTGTPLAAASSTSETNDRLVGTFTLVAEQLAKQLSTRLNRALVPGQAEQITRWSGVKKAGWIPFGVGAATVIAGAVSLGLSRGNYAQLQMTRQADAAAGSALAPLTPNQAGAYVATGKTEQTLGWAGVGIGAGLLAAAAGLFLFGGDEVISAGVTLAPGSASVGIAGVW
jgi:hypothetical protein